MNSTNALLTLFLYVQCYTIFIFAYFRQVLCKFGYGLHGNDEKILRERSSMSKFAPLYDDFRAVYAKIVYWKHRDCGNRVVISPPDHVIKVRRRRTVDNGWTLTDMDGVDEVVNFGSYNYLGFSQNHGPCAVDSVKSIKSYGLGLCSAKHELGNQAIHEKLERLLAAFLGVEDAACFSMGFSTNTANIGCLVGPDSLILSDQFNHSSIVVGCRLSLKARLEIFRHNDLNDLERKLQRAIISGQTGDGRRPFDKIIVCVEGIYSMEGTIVPLPQILALKRAYKFYLYLDEAHSIGALGSSGRGVCEYFGVDPNEIDLLMGTFTKGFGSVGGYLAGRKRTIDHIRACSPANVYGVSLSAPCVQQVITSLDTLMGRLDCQPPGRHRVENLARNTSYFQERLKALNIPVYGDAHSPVITVPLYFMTKIVFASRCMLNAGIGVVVVAFPATSLTSTRIRFCLSALHTKDDLDRALNALNMIKDIICIPRLTASKN